MRFARKALAAFFAALTAYLVFQRWHPFNGPVLHSLSSDVALGVCAMITVGLLHDPADRKSG